MLFLRFVFFLLSVALANDQPTCDTYVSGPIGDADATVELLQKINREIFPKLKEILYRDYFRFFRANMNTKCLFWPEEKQCVLRACQVEGCSNLEVPPGLLTEKSANLFPTLSYQAMGQISSSDRPAKEKDSDDPADCSDQEESLTLGRLDPTLSPERKITVEKWAPHDESDVKQFCDINDISDENSTYIDLMRNDEKYTGYKGDSAFRIWSAIYRENCFRSDPRSILFGSYYSPVDRKTCKEKRLFFRFISGLHSSINLNICYHYLLSKFGGASSFLSSTDMSVWGPNVEEFQRRFLPSHDPQAPARLYNLYLLYAMEIRAIAKVAPLLRQQAYFTGNEANDAKTRADVLQLLNLIEPHKHVFDESSLFSNHDQELITLKEEFRMRFMNITRIMDCVGCDKCKIWGKLQISGMATALKILFSDNLFHYAPDGTMFWRPDFQLTRVEIVALFNAFGKLASSLSYLDIFCDMIKKK